jgi:hypothetical protein
MDDGKVHSRTFFRLWAFLMPQKPGTSRNGTNTSQIKGEADDFT